ncbi:MAG: FtsW/RodA/SpoVE family cell cycle protein, partial [bacterium]|nr:FtsW/RodA/SpoVE family cell cycle protein [bacterium]
MKLRDMDPVVLFGAVALTAFGVVMMYSASHILALDRFGDPLHFVKRHLLWAGVGFAVMLGVCRLRLEWLQKMAYPILILSFVALALVFVPGIGRAAGGARRWAALGPIVFQPAEVAKLGLVIFLAHILSVKSERLQEWKYGFLPPVAVIALVLALILVQPDLGTAILIAGVSGFLLFIAGA